MKTTYYFVYILLIPFLCNCSNPKDVQKNTDRINIEHQERKLLSDPTNTLTGKLENLELEYIVWGCACANWIPVADKIKYEDSGLAKHCIFIEPADSTLNIPVSFDPLKQRIKINGQFYLQQGFPIGTLEGEEHLEKAKVFRYTSLKVVDSR